MLNVSLTPKFLDPPTLFPLPSNLSPIYYNNPAFRVVEYDDETHRPTGMAVHYAENITTPGLLSWHSGLNLTKDYSALSEAVARDGYLSQKAYTELSSDLSKGGADWNLYAAWYKSKYSSYLMSFGCDPLVPSSDDAVDDDQTMLGLWTYLCATTVVPTKAEFEECVNGYSTQGAVATCELAAPSVRDEFWTTWGLITLGGGLVVVLGCVKQFNIDSRPPPSGKILARLWIISCFL